MTLHFTYCDTAGYEYNLAGARSKHKAVEFDLDVADVTPASAVGAKPFQQELLDGQKWELSKKYRLKQSVTTYPNLNLNGLTLTINGKRADYTYSTLLLNWYKSRSRWITTPDMTDAKVVLTSNDLEFQKTEGVRFLQAVTFEVETCGVY